MIEIHTLQNLSAADLAPLTGPVISFDTFQVRFTGTEERTCFELQLVPLSRPHTRYDDHIDQAWVETWLRSADFSFGAYDGNRLVGALIAEKHDWNNSLWVWEFLVATDWRRQGIGRMLMEHTAEKAIEAGLRTIVCETQNRNSSAIKAYQSMGFRVEGIDISYYSNEDYPDGDVAVFMKRRLIR